MGKLTKEEIILLFLDDPKKLADELYFNHKNFPKSDEIRTLICELGDPRCAYRYAHYIDQEYTEETYKVLSKNPWFAYCWSSNAERVNMIKDFKSS